MIRVVVLALLLGSAVPAQAERTWEFLNQDLDGRKFYVDPSSVRPVAEGAQMWHLMDKRRAGSTAVLLAYDCAGKRTRRLMAYAYVGAMASGRLAMQEREDPRWNPTRSGNVDDALLRYACTAVGHPGDNG